MGQTVDKKRLALGLLLLILLAGGVGAWAKEAIPNFFAQPQPQLAETTPPTATPGAGEVAGLANTQIDSEKKKEDFSLAKQDLQKQIDEIKKSITELKPEDVKEQAPVQKILRDLDDFAQQATESIKVLDVKGNLCEEVKRRFCQ